MPKLVDHDQYRKELLSKCFDLFAKKGYASITMRQIAEGLGVSTGTLYHYFSSKETLFEQLVEEQTQQDIIRITAELENAHTLAERIEAAFNFVAKNEDYFLKQLLIWVDFYRQQSLVGIYSNHALKQAGQRAKQATADLLGIQDPALVIFVLGLFDGLILQRLYEGEAVAFAEQATLLGKMLSAYLEKE